MNGKIAIFSLWLIAFSIVANAQSEYAKNIVKELCSSKYWGRGYINNGMKNAAIFIQNEMKNAGLIPIANNNYFQEFELSTNTFPGAMELKLDGKKLQAGRDYLVNAASKGIKGNFKLQPSKKQGIYFNQENKLVLEATPKLVWTPSLHEEDVTHILIKDSSYTPWHQVAIEIDQKFEPKYKVNNICAMVHGTLYPDSFLVLTAHYDHLGGMGKEVYFPGANDNASGVALMLDLAQYYSKNPQKYSIVFIAFAAEEIGLEGSKYFVENPLLQLNKIKFLLNLDLMGNGEDGITIVNADGHKDDFNKIEQANSKQKWFSVVNARNNAPNSDHYPFTQKKVPAFFIYTLGGNQAYHDVYDVPETLPLRYYPQLSAMIKYFFKSF